MSTHHTCRGMSVLSEIQSIFSYIRSHFQSANHTGQKLGRSWCASQTVKQMSGIDDGGRRVVDWSGEFQVDLYSMTHGISLTRVGPSLVRRCTEGCAGFLQLLVCVCTWRVCVCVVRVERVRERKKVLESVCLINITLCYWPWLHVIFLFFCVNHNHLNANFYSKSYFFLLELGRKTFSENLLGY